MPRWGVIPSIRVRDMAEALAFYMGPLEFTLDSGSEEATNSSLTRADGHLMIETAADFYSDQYNEAIRERLGARSPIALYIEADDLAAFYSRLKAHSKRSDHRSPRSTTLGSGGIHRRGSRG